MSVDFDFAEFYETCHENGMTDEEIESELEYLDYRAEQALETYLIEKDEISFGELLYRSNRMLHNMAADLEIYQKEMAKMADDIKSLRSVI